MELFTAGDQSQMKTIERWIDESDVYMLILGGRYGSIEPISGLSYTELEYDYAVAHGKPTFAVVITEAALEQRVKARGSDVLEKEYPKLLTAFRSKVLSNISSFFSDEKDIKLCVYESMSDHSENTNLSGWVSANEIEDAQALNEEIRKLREENVRLTETVKQMKAVAASKSGTSRTSFEDLKRLLQAIELTVPAKATSNNKAIKNNLLKLMYNMKDRLINGVTNSINSGELDTFLYFELFPKLQAHDLADNEKVAGSRYRRSFLNREGRAFIAQLDREILLDNAMASSPPDAAERHSTD